LIPPAPSDSVYASFDLLWYFRSYVYERLNEMFNIVYPEMKMRMEYFDGDDRFVWSRRDTEPPTRFAAIVVVKPGTLQESNLKYIMATSDRKELDFISGLTFRLSVLNDSTVEAITKLRDLYNDYGCCNIAVCDFDNILAVDMRPRLKQGEPRKLARAEFSPMGRLRKDWRRFQNTLLGFLERGAQWTTPSQTSSS
jgi:hypothetical protein